MGAWPERWHTAKGLTEESFMEGLFIQGYGNTEGGGKVGGVLFCEMSSMGKYIEKESRLTAARGGGRREWGVPAY